MEINKRNIAKTKILFSVSLILILSACKQITEPSICPSEQSAKPWAYWWWMGSSVTKEGISKNLELYQKAGFGGLHIIPIYGEKGDENNFIQFLSPQWMDMLVHTVNVAEELGLGIDMTTGTGWPFGGPNVGYENAAKKIVIKKLDLKLVNSTAEITKGIKNAKVVALSGMKPDSTYANLTENIKNDGSITVTTSYGKAFALIMIPTAQKVKRAAPGGEGLVMDYFNLNALNHYFERFQLAFDSSQFLAGKVRAFYNDSYEAYGANFTANFLEKFKKLRGYDLSNYLHVLADTAKSQIKERIVTDYCETISDLLYSEFSEPWVRNSNSLGMLTRNQAHGSPGNLIDLYAIADIPETESFGVSDIPIPGLRKDPDYQEARYGRPNPLAMKFASSAAHIKDKKLVASETATWLGDHFKVALSQVKPQIDELFTAGINHIILHGITYNPPEKPFPGRLFYASTNFGPLSHFWNELPALNKYIERCQEILQNSQPNNDVLVYFPIHDIWAKKYTEELLVRFDVHHSERWLKRSQFGKLATYLWEEGFSFDYVSDKMIADVRVKNGNIQFEGGSYKTIVIPESLYMPEKTMEKLYEIARKGAKILFMENLPKSVPGFNDLKERNKKYALLKDQVRPFVKITQNISDELSNIGIVNEELTSLGLSFIRKTKNEEIIYFVSNLGDKFNQGPVHLSTKSKQVELLDPLNGVHGITNSIIENEKTLINLHLEPGQSCIIKCRNNEIPEQKWIDRKIETEAIVIDSEWTVKPVNRERFVPKTMHITTFKSWPLLGTDWSIYSGKAQYTCEFEIMDKYIGQEMLIYLGDVRETARIKINDSDIGLIWCLPYKIIIPENILKKKNKIEIEVTNLSFNKVIELERNCVQWKNFHEINFVNIKYEPYDASNKEPVASGLLSPIKLYPILNE